MDKLNRRYVTLNPVEGNMDAYSSVSFDFTGVKDRMSLTVNGDDSENKCYFVVVKDGTKYIGFYLGDLVKKSEGKYELKKECGKLGTTIYTLKDVIAVEVVDKVENKVLYQGLVDSKNDFNGKYTIVVDKPVIVKKEIEPTTVIVEVDEVVDNIKKNNVDLHKYEELDDVEVKEMLFSNKNTGLGIEVGKVIGGTDEGVVGEKTRGGEDEGVEVGKVSEGEYEDEEIDGGDRRGGEGFGENVNGNHIHDNDQDRHKDCDCNECKYKIYYEIHNQEEKRNIYDDFEVFSQLYEGYLRSEYINSLENVEELEELEELEEKDSIVILDRLEPTIDLEESKTIVIKSKFRTLEDDIGDSVEEEIEKEIEKKPIEIDEEVKEKKRSKSVDDFYDNFLGTKGKNKGNSFVDMINHVKKEFESIREIMSLSDEEFARRAEHEYKAPVSEQKRSTNTFVLRGLKDLVESRVEFKPFEMQGREVSWVQIKLNEVVGFFDNYWKLFWEPFVVDAYTENKHLLLGVERVEGNENYFFGVPAFYSMEVVNKAFDLGFELFEVVGNNIGEITDGVRGYFIKELKPTESYKGRESRNNEKKNVEEVDDKDTIRFAEGLEEESVGEIDIETDINIGVEEKEKVYFGDKLILTREEDENIV